MTYKNDFDSLKENFFKYLIKINDNKVFLYLYFFIFYFLLFYTITIPETISPKTNSYIKNILDKHKLIGLSIIIFLNFIYVSSIFYLVYKYKSTNELIAILVPLTLSGIILFFDVLLFSKYLSYISNWILLKFIFIVISNIFFIIFLCLFFYNINNQLNVEFFISLIVLFIFLFVNIFKTSNNLNNITIPKIIQILIINCKNIVINYNKPVIGFFISKSKYIKLNENTSNDTIITYEFYNSYNIQVNNQNNNIFIIIFCDEIFINNKAIFLNLFESCCIIIDNNITYF